MMKAIYSRAEENRAISSIYIHIPFCKTICSYCDFCKLFYNEKLVNQYLDALQKEIEETYQNEEIETIYVGGGTPSCLTIPQLEKLFQMIQRFRCSNLKEFTVEMNSDDITEAKLCLFKHYGVNRISIGHQTKHSHYLHQLGRNNSVTKKQIQLVKKYFENINLDLMYGFHTQTREDFLEDLEYIINLDIPHISTYSLILEEHTKLFIQNYQRLNDEEDAWMYQTLQHVLEENGFQQYEISNFSKEGYHSFHNLVYWNNEHYHGFGLGASGYINNIRYTNTRSIQQYLQGNFCFEIENLTIQDKMIYEMILGLRKVKGVSKTSFLEKYGCNIEQIFDIINLMNQAVLQEKDDYLFIPKEYLYRENQILVHFLEVKSEK